MLLAIGGCFLIEKVALQQNAFIQLLFILAGLYVTLSVSLNLINGITGQFSIGHAAFYMIGAYATGVVARNYYTVFEAWWLGWHLPMPMLAWLVVAMFAGAIVAGAAGFLVGLPSLRLKGDYLAIVTMGFGEIISIVVRNQEKLGRAYGMQIEPRLPSIFMVWLLAVVCVAVCRNLLKNVHGLSFLAVREDEVASSAMGVDVTRIKVTAFVLGSAFAGAAGALYAHSIGFISPPNFSMDVSFIILTMVVLGGTGSITGSVISALLLFYIPEKMRDLKDVPMAGVVAVGIALVVAVALIKRISDGHDSNQGRKAAKMFGALALGVVVQIVMTKVLANVPSLAGQIEGSKLRLVVFAITLVILMLLRPQGIFAHHEFSWNWVRKLFGKKDVPTTAVSA
ncbi:MAG: branched-chain amino acid ABC transporter permease [Fimbriimonadales bacterium]